MAIRLTNWFFQTPATGVRFLTNDVPTQATFQDLIDSKVNKWTTDPEDNPTLHDYATKSDVKTSTNNIKVVTSNNLPTFRTDYINTDVPYTPDNVVLANSDGAFTIPSNNIKVLDTDAVANTLPKLVMGFGLGTNFIAYLRKVVSMVKNLWYPTKADIADVEYSYQLNGTGTVYGAGSYLTYSSVTKGNLVTYNCVISNTFTEATSAHWVKVAVTLPIQYNQVLGLYGGSFIIVHFPNTAETAAFTGVSCTSFATLSLATNLITFNIIVPKTYIKAVRDASLSGYDFKAAFTFDVLATA